MNKMVDDNILTTGFKRIRLSDGLYIIHIYRLDEAGYFKHGEKVFIDKSCSDSYAHQRADGKWIYTFGYDTSESMTDEAWDTLDQCIEEYIELIYDMGD